MLNCLQDLPCGLGSLHPVCCLEQQPVLTAQSIQAYGQLVEGFQVVSLKDQFSCKSSFYFRKPGFHRSHKRHHGGRMLLLQFLSDLLRFLLRSRKLHPDPFPVIFSLYINPQCLSLPSGIFTASGFPETGPFPMPVPHPSGPPARLLYKRSCERHSILPRSPDSPDKAIPFRETP